MQKFDLIIIGGGAGAFAAAIRANELKEKTALINAGLPVGGTCVNVGCVPSKTLLWAGEVMHHAQNHGIPVTVLGITSPDALVTIKIPKLTLSVAKVADEEGHFIFTFNDVPPGVYELIVSAMKGGSANETSQIIGVPDSPAVTEMSVSDIQLPLVSVKQIKKQKADLDKDGRVDMRDLSILLYHWTSSMFYTPYNKDVDLNGDDRIDLKDISLMISQWTN